MTEEIRKCFETLALPPDASQSEIKKAYFRLVRTFPPEKEPEQFQKIRHAYETLKQAPSDQMRQDIPLPKDPEVQYLIRQTNLWIEKENYKRADYCLNAALEIMPDDPYLLLQQAHLQYKAGHPRKAARTAQRLQKIAPECIPAYSIAAAGLYEGGWYKKALSEYRKAYEMGERNLSFVTDYADVAAANGRAAEAEQLRAGLLWDTKWDKSNIDTALYLFSGLAKLCPTEENPLLALLDSYLSFLSAHKRLIRLLDDEVLIPITVALLEKEGALRFSSVYHKGNALLETVERLSDRWKDQVLHIRNIITVAAVRSDDRFSDTRWPEYATVILFPDADDPGLQRYAKLDGVLCLMRQGEKSRARAEIIRKDYPIFYQQDRDNIDLIASGDFEKEYKQKKREYARLSERYKGGMFYDLYPEERSEAQGVLFYHSSDPFVRKTKKIGRNDPCPCGSGRKFKRCCIGKGIYD